MPGMPDRHSRPAPPRATAAATTASHGSPAAAAHGHVVARPRSSPDRAAPRPRRGRRRRHRRSRGCCRRRARTAARLATRPTRARPRRRPADDARDEPARGPADAKRGARRQRRRLAGPPAQAPRPSPASSARQRRQRLGARAELELDPVARRELAGERQIGGDHRGDERIAAGHLAVGHQQDRLPGRRHLQCRRHRWRPRSCRAVRAGSGCGAREPVAHAVRLGRDLEARASQQRRAPRAESSRRAVPAARARARRPAAAAAARSGSPRGAPGGGAPTGTRSPARSRRPCQPPSPLVRSVARLPRHGATSRPPSSARYARAPARRVAEAHDRCRRRAPPARRAAAAARRSSRRDRRPRPPRHRHARGAASKPPSVASRAAAPAGLPTARLASRNAARVHRAAHRHALVLMAPAPAVLHGRHQPGLERRCTARGAASPPASGCRRRRPRGVEGPERRRRRPARTGRGRRARAATPARARRRTAAWWCGRRSASRRATPADRRRSAARRCPPTRRDAQARRRVPRRGNRRVHRLRGTRIPAGSPSMKTRYSRARAARRRRPARARRAAATASRSGPDSPPYSTGISTAAPPGRSASSCGPRLQQRAQRLDVGAQRVEEHRDRAEGRDDVAHAGHAGARTPAASADGARVDGRRRCTSPSSSDQRRVAGVADPRRWSRGERLQQLLMDAAEAAVRHQHDDIAGALPPPPRCATMSSTAGMWRARRPALRRDRSPAARPTAAPPPAATSGTRRR